MPSADRQPAFVLIRPQMGENIGAAARGMWNFGLDRMRIIAPRDGWPNQKAVAMASGAGRLLDEAQIFDDTQAALADCDYVYATTARPRGLTKLVLSPEAAMQDARARIAEGQKVAVMFGPERAGMENDDIARANAIISVPVNPEFPSLNLAQCVLLTGMNGGARQLPCDAARVDAAGDWAEQIEIEKLGDHYEERLQTLASFTPSIKPRA